MPNAHDAATDVIERTNTSIYLLTPQWLRLSVVCVSTNAKNSETSGSDRAARVLLQKLPPQFLQLIVLAVRWNILGPTPKKAQIPMKGDRLLPRDSLVVPFLWDIFRLKRVIPKKNSIQWILWVYIGII